jgi:ATP-binding cassette, subfamily B, multidrug efflux pump
MSPRFAMQEDKADRFFDRDLLRNIWRFARPYGFPLFFTFILLLVTETLPFLLPHLLEQILDGPLKERNWLGVKNLIILYLIVVIVHALLMYIKSVLMQTLGLTIINKLRTALFAHVQKLPLSFFHKNPMGRLMTRLTNDVDTLNSLFTEGLLDLLSSLLMLILATSIMLYKDWKLGLATMIVFPLMVKATSIFRIKVRNINQIIRANLAAFNSVLQESLAGIRIVQLFNRQSTRLQKYKEFNRSYRNAFLRNVKYYSLFFPTISTLTDFSMAVCFFTGAWLIYSGESSTGALLAFTWYANMFNRPLRDLSDKITSLQTSAAAAERVFTLFNEQPEGNPGKQLCQKSHWNQNLRFEHVAFGYSSETPVIKNFSLEVRSGETLALVGATGAGKSTLFHLINRFYKPNQGTIHLGGIAATDFELSSWRTNIANVNQDILLFNDTIQKNLTLWDESPDFAKLEYACAKAQILPLINSLPKGFEQVLGAEGYQLSTGQKQLFTFARALYHDPALLLLDEATSSVDAQTELLLQKAMEEVVTGRTSIIIAHRLSTVKRADRILVMHHGEIREQGTHLELLSQNGIYSKLVRMQQLQDHT